MAEFIHGDLSYKIIGVLYKVYNHLGGGYQEKYYQQAIKNEFLTQNISFQEQVKSDLYYKKEKIGKYYMDFIVDHKIVLELKVSPLFSTRDIMQVLGYLKQSKLELGILASLNRNNVHFKRIL